MAQPPYQSIAQDVNPDGGRHPISAIPAEKAAADRATRRSWREFPYYAQRYGQRGFKFSLSDSGWLETLPDLSVDTAIAQMHWLAGLLAARGMPRVLLERHLAFLKLELDLIEGDLKRDFSVLTAGAESLRAACEKVLPSATAAELAADFDSDVKHLPGSIANMGIILVGGIADGHDGIGNARESTLDWARDPQRFDERWIRAVEKIEEATCRHLR